MPMRHATLRQLQVFEAAARHLSFSRAAAELHLTQPGVSMQMQRARGPTPGCRCSSASARRMHLTEAGRELLLRHAHDVQRALADAEERSTRCTA